MKMKVLVVAACVLMSMVPSVAAAGPGDEGPNCRLEDGLILYVNCGAGNWTHNVCEIIFGPDACDDET